MKKESIIVLFSVVALAACSNDEGLLSAEEASGADDTRVDSEQNEAIENTNENDDNKDENEEENESNSVENNDEDESDSNSPSEEETNDNAEGSENEEDQAAEDNVGMTAEEIIENAIAAEAQLDSYSLEWTYHDVAEDGTVQEARDYEIQRYFANADGVDYFYRQLTGVDEEENPLTMYEAQTPEARTVYRDVDEVVVLMEPEDQTVPTVSRYDLQSLLDDDGYVLTYEGVFEIGGYETHHINAVTDENNVEMNFWFDTDTGLQVRQNSFYAGLDGQVSILTNIETGTDFNESEYIVDAPSSVPVQDER
ncbi:hypothetical protein JOC54_000702 [Alkalihalobacillus xiaoxiensis]|uniref:Outer membrane lipoprotein-sorting protein n=1 Tax=Shouchella xiaoxiensis TaxID=766895 RepID=A0ABS2SPL9_9BACI|nr:hypothetical protein [Shouchella xiaoxiensis]MBM7837471.1 hypothetical protein [Shouchella xiaoxiensis]